MRIVGGAYRGRRLAVPEGLDVRPSADRTREAVFNVLEHWRYGDGRSLVDGARVLDAFCGTGAYGLEALSRGAEEVTLLDHEPRALDAARANARGMDAGGRLHWVMGDATGGAGRAAVARVHAAVDLVFMDPPWGSGLWRQALDALHDRGWIGAESLVVLELSARETFDPPPGWTVIDERRHGAAVVRMLVLD